MNIEKILILKLVTELPVQRGISSEVVSFKHPLTFLLTGSSIKVDETVLLIKERLDLLVRVNMRSYDEVNCECVIEIAI